MNYVSKIRVGVISDGKYGDRAYESFKKFFDTLWIPVPEIPSTTILDDDINLDIPDCDLYVSYIRHPDILLEIAALQKPLILGVTPGRGFSQQAKQINPNVISPRTMCSLESNTGVSEIDEFANYFGKPIYASVSNDDNKVTQISVVRSSPCGSSQAGAEFIKDKEINVKNLQDLALSVCHECRAPRFGHTCDKEISGIIHILSLYESLNPDDKDKISIDVKFFIEKLKKEYQSRMLK